MREDGISGIGNYNISSYQPKEIQKVKEDNTQAKLIFPETLKETNTTIEKIETTAKVFKALQTNNQIRKLAENINKLDELYNEAEKNGNKAQAEKYLKQKEMYQKQLEDTEKKYDQINEKENAEKAITEAEVSAKEVKKPDPTFGLAE